MGLPPSEFWITDPKHFWWLVGAARDEAEQNAGPRLTDADREELYRMIEEAQANG
jgi:hypothetical protein